MGRIETYPDGTKKRIKPEQEHLCKKLQAEQKCALDKLEPGALLVKIKAACAACPATVTTSQDKSKNPRYGLPCILTGGQPTPACDHDGPCCSCPRKREAF